jgi:pyruvate dehydrogenase (quinone)
MNELITIRKYIDKWGDTPQFIILVQHNNDLTQVSWEMRTEDANPLWSGSQNVESVDYAGWAELLGFNGIRVRNDDEVAAAWEAAFAYHGVTLIDAYTSKNVPPLPPHITLEYAKNTGEALLKGDPSGFNVIKDSAKALLVEGVARVKGKLHIGQDDKFEQKDKPKEQ